MVDTRASKGGRAVRRRRECPVCETRFTTYEVVEEHPLQVLKRSGAAEDFDREKLLKSIKVACVRRPVSPSDIEVTVEHIEEDLSREVGVEMESARIGELVMGVLQRLDRVAYVRYASVYRDFQDTGEFRDAVDELDSRQDRELLSLNQVELPLP